VGGAQFGLQFQSKLVRFCGAGIGVTKRPGDLRLVFTHSCCLPLLQVNSSCGLVLSCARGSALLARERSLGLPTNSSAGEAVAPCTQCRTLLMCYPGPRIN
jgi:hypothetical protein